MTRCTILLSTLQSPYSPITNQSSSRQSIFILGVVQEPEDRLNERTRTTGCCCAWIGYQCYSPPKVTKQLWPLVLSYV